MKVRVFALLAAVLLMLLMCGTAYAKRGVVRVRVMDAGEKGNERRVAGATVQVWDKDGNIVAEATTDEKGEATFDDLEGKTEYTVRAIAPDGKIGTKSVTTNKNGGGGTQIVYVR